VSAAGANVGGHQTMVSAVAMYTHGLGGDSRVRHDDRVVGASLIIGPQRVIPVGLIALHNGDLVHSALDRQLRSDVIGDLDGIFLVAADRAHWNGLLDPSERRVLDSFSGDLGAAGSALDTLVARRIADRLVRRGALQYAAFTPSDANHVLGRQDTFDRSASLKAAELFARRRDRMGRAIALDGATISQLTIDTLVRRSAEAVLGAAFDRDSVPVGSIASPLVQRALDRSLATVHVSIGISIPLIGLGASAPSYYPAVAALLRTTAVVPEHADVANAVGAVVGRVRISRSCTISSPQPGRFVVHAGTPTVHGSLEAARAAAQHRLEIEVHADMVSAGAPAHETSVDWTDVTVEVGGSPMFVEGTLVITGSGRPDLSLA
jgi:N-methylhydantoinase A/oxoprolinase/acetone carboxylase beta subunit